MTETLSVDHIIFEKYRDGGHDCISVQRFDRSGDKLPCVSFSIGNGPAAFNVLSQIAELMGVKITAATEDK